MTRRGGGAGGDECSTTTTAKQQKPHGKGTAPAHSPEEREMSSSVSVCVTRRVLRIFSGSQDLQCCDYVAGLIALPAAYHVQLASCRGLLLQSNSVYVKSF